MGDEKARLAWQTAAGSGPGKFGDRRFEDAMRQEDTRHCRVYLKNMLSSYEASLSLDEAITNNAPKKDLFGRATERDMPDTAWRLLCMCHMARHWRVLREGDRETVRRAMDVWARVVVPQADDEGDGALGALQADHVDPGARRMRR
jgi:hypothetical protein